MSYLFLDLKDKPRVVDFLVEASEYAAPKDRAAAEKWVKLYQEGEKTPTDKLAEAARELAMATWPARFAVDHFFTHEGAKEEWDRVVATVRPSTAHLMKRFRQGLVGAHGNAPTLDEVLKHDEVGTALHDEEMYEIAEVRSHLRHDFWKTKGEILAVLAKGGEKELKGYEKRLEKLRELAAAFPPALQDEIFSKITNYEDRILFAGEVVSLEVMDEEIKYYTDQKEISPLEG